LIYLHSTSDRQRTLAAAVADRAREELGGTNPRGTSVALVAIDPGPRVGDLTFDAIDWTLDRATSVDEIHERLH
jgi:hypothetical protein